MDIAFGQELRRHLDIILHLYRLLLQDIGIIRFPGDSRAQRNNLRRSNFPFLLTLHILAEMLARLLLQRIQNHFAVRCEHVILIEQAA
ncbi:hypothetical protein D3C84_1155900 [compost metagenome]